MVKLVKYGDKRPGTRKLLKGERYSTDKGDVFVEADCVVRTTEKYCTTSYSNFGQWMIDETHWDQIVAPNPPPPPDPKPGFWARLFKRNKLPEARVVCLQEK